MRILYDGHIFGQQPAGGINRYFANLIDNLPDHVRPILTTTRAPRTNFPRHNNLELHIRQWRLPKALGTVRRALQRSYFRRVSSFVAPDVIHSTYYQSLAGCEFQRGGPPLIITVHDMTHERFPALLDRRRKHARAKRIAINRADGIICVSHKTRADLLEMYPHVADRVTVIYHGAGMGAVRWDESISPSAHPTFLFVGSRAVYKNFDRLLDALRMVARTSPKVRLNVIGPPFSRNEQNLITARGLQKRVIHQGVISDAHLARLYRQSIALVYPSLYEGFGLPLLEAMSLGTPILASNTSSIPEVTGDAAILFDPTSTDELAFHMSRLLDNNDLRTSLSQRGYLRCRLFDWSRTATETLKVYRAVA